MDNNFRETDETGNLIRVVFTAALLKIERLCDIHYKDPKHDIARRFLNEIVEFKAEEK